MLLMNRRTAIKIGNGTGYLEDTGVGAGGETEAVGHQFQHTVAAGVQFTVFLYEARSHLGIAVDFGSFVTFQLDFSRMLNAFGDCCRAFRFAPVGQITIFDSGHFDMDIDTIQQRAGDTGTVAVNGNRSAGAGVSRIG